jgi:hypothetical protein
MMTVGMHPRRGSQGQVAEGGLDVEASFAEVDGQTAARLGAEARANQGRNAVDMLTSHVEEGAAVSEELRYEGPEG